MLSKKEYVKKASTLATKSPLYKNIIKAFAVGGAICTLGQVIFNLTVYYFPLQTELPKIVTPVVLIFLSALFTGLGLYDNLAKFAGAGTAVPITGFANAIVAPAIEFKKEGVVLGMCSKMFVIAGPVLVFGVTSSIIYGIIYYIVKIYF